MAGLFPRETEASLRNVLGSYNIKGSMATSDVTALTVVFFVLEQKVYSSTTLTGINFDWNSPYIRMRGTHIHC